MRTRDDYLHPAPVLVGVDGSASSKEALAWAAHYAGLVGAQLEVAIVWHLPPAMGWETPVPTEWNPEDDARSVLDSEVEEVLGSKRPTDTTLLVLEGPPAKVLTERAHAASLVVVGSRGRGQVAGMLLGSVSEALARHAPCPVVVVRHGAEG
jgi:nucleotide-binding universal stress UspA family protein